MKIKIFRQIDRLGRLVIPVDLRKQYGIKAGDTVCLTTDDDGVLILANKQNTNECTPSERIAT